MILTWVEDNKNQEQDSVKKSKFMHIRSASCDLSTINLIIQINKLGYPKFISYICISNNKKKQ